MKHFHTVGLLVLVGLLALTQLAGCSWNEDQQENIQQESSAQPDQILYGTRITITEAGKTQAIIEANIVNIYEDSSYASLEDSVSIKFFDREGVHTSTLTAELGEIWGMYESADSLKATGDVVIQSEQENARVEAPAIRWITGEGIVYGVGLVKLTTENGFEQGTGFEAKDDLSEYRFRGPVSGEVRGEELKLIDRRDDE